METFSWLSQFAQTWAVAGMAGFFVLVVLWAFRPGSNAVYDDAANSIFRHDTKPVDESEARKSRAEPVRP
jgi:cytochrome c oxidase cbb3-type subunit IV